MAWISEVARQTPVVEETDVIVCGAGPAGICAAIAAARAGARVRLIENHGCLGGIWTAGSLAWILDALEKGGLLQEIVARLQTRGAAHREHWTAVIADVEVLKLLLEEMCVEAGVQVRMHTRVVAAQVEAGRLRAVVTESKSGREAWAARMFIDATGDGDLGALAGCRWEMGRPAGDGAGQTQPMSLIAVVGGVRFDAIEDCVHTAEKPWRKDSDRIKELLKANGLEPSYGAPILMRVYDDLFLMMANHEYGVKGTDAGDLTRATMHARAEVHRIIDSLRSHGGPWAGVKLVATAAQIGVREGRRIRGRYMVTADDLINGIRHEDAVCRVTFPVDVHSTDPKSGKAMGGEGVKAKPYDIPLRALIAADVEGLMMAGRCISGDFIAHASYRVTGNAAAMGEAAGRAAAFAARQGVAATI